MTKARNVADLGSNDVLETTSTGIDVTGTATMDGLTVRPSTGAGVLEIGTTQTDIGGPDTSFATLNFYNGDVSNSGPAITASMEIQTNDIYSQGGDIVFKNRATPAQTLDQRMRIDSNGDISFYEDTGTTAKFFWDASAESLGIGTTSPQYPLDVYKADSGTVARFRTANKNPILSIYSGYNGDWTAGEAKGGIYFYSSDSSGMGAGNHAWIQSLAQDIYGANTSLAFGTASAGGNATERMRIDSSGNLLVGQNAASSTTQGASIRSSGQLIVATTNTNPTLLNRMGSDGDIAVFRKDGTTVGSIGTKAGDLTIGDADIGIRFDTGAGLIPWNMTTNSSTNGASDLGASTARFKDLYLSGRIYQGGSNTSYTPITYVKHAHYGGGSGIFATLVTGKAQLGELFAYNTSTNGWCHYSLKKNDESASLATTQLAGTGLTITATNAGGTIQMSDTSTSVKMIVTIYVVEE